MTRIIEYIIPIGNTLTRRNVILVNFSAYECVIWEFKVTSVATTKAGAIPLSKVLVSLPAIRDPMIFM
jgi:hypothetical protein